MSPSTRALVRLGFLATARSHGVRAAAALALLLTLFAPALVAFAFSGAGALAFEGAVGTACLIGPLLALFAGVSFAAGDRGGEGLDPMLRASAGPGTVVLGAALGIALAASTAVLLCTAAAAAALHNHGTPPGAADLAGPVAAALGATFAAAAVGIALGTAAPRSLATLLATLLLALALAGDSLLPGGFPALPGAEVFLLSRDAAFGELPPAVVALSLLTSLLLAGAAAAAAVALVRSKDVAPRPGSS